MKIQLIWIGKTKANFIKQGIDFYAKKLRHFTSLEIKEVKEMAKGACVQPSQQALIKKKEGEKLQLACKQSSFIVCLDEKGNTFTSIQFAKWLNTLEDRGTRNLAFIIGGPFGLDEKVIQNSHYRLSLSPMTFTHDMTRLILLEQLYRAYTIIRNIPYHY